MTPNLKAFLDMLAWAEGTSTSPITKNNGYDVIVNGYVNGRSVPEVFSDYSDHPFNKGRSPKVFSRNGQKSSASGRYQIMRKDWPHYRDQLKLPDFGPESQDKYAIQLIKERRALTDIESGNIESAIVKCSNIWASLPGAGYGQREHAMASLIDRYQKSGGKLS